jgi:hypothetical protein
MTSGASGPCRPKGTAGGHMACMAWHDTARHGTAVQIHHLLANYFERSQCVVVGAVAVAGAGSAGSWLPRHLL